MAENFDLIFGQNASQQYAWNDTDYQNGWETIGNIPPTAAQFDALQRRNDTKMKELNDELTPLVNADTADSRQPSTTYSVDDIKYSPLLPTGWFLTCTVNGTTSASELVVPSPVAEGDEITDGGVTWKIKKIGGAGDAGDGVPLGAILPLAHNSTIPAGYLLCDGSAVSRTMFPDLFAAIGTTYGAGDGSTTFNVPDYNSAKRFCQGDTVAGTVKQAGLPNITGGATAYEFTGESDPASLPECFADNGKSVYFSSISSAGISTSGKSLSTNKGSTPPLSAALNIDASRSNSIYGNSDTVQPPALTCRYIIKAFDGQTPDSALIDITQYAQELAGKADRALDNLSTDGENHFLENDFTIIYPNGGTEANPGTVTTGTRYIEPNPFPGYYIHCIAEVYYQDKWGRAYFTTQTSQQGVGVNANPLGDDSIVITTGDSTFLMMANFAQGHPFNYASLVNPPLPCRVKVWKIGKIPD